jgi:nicotinate-nucleotide adenylyltransferase
LTPTSERLPAGIFGGTFDPIHLGHVAVAEQAADALGLDRVLLVPAARPPHRRPPEASPEDRLAMAQRAAAGHPRLEVSDVEVARPGPSYTVDTVRDLLSHDPGRAWMLLLGWDAAREFGDWHEAPEIVSLVDVAVFNRAGEDAPEPGALAEVGLPLSTRILTVDSPLLSADEIRARLAAGDDVSDAVDPEVLRYIRSHGLYRG